jgi:RNA polymerase sigma factor (sigma-70 family)
MKAVSRGLEIRIEEINERGVLRLEALDALLLDDRRFNATVEALNRRLDSAVEITGTAAGMEDEGPMDTAAGRRRRPATISRRDNDLTQRRMSRTDEYRWAKRLEFHRRRLCFFLGSLDPGCGGPFKELIRSEPSAPPHLARIDDVLNTNPRLTGIEKRAAGALWRYYIDCRSGWVERNLWMVSVMVRKYRSYGVSAGDLSQEGNTAMIRAVEKYDWRKKMRFWTYAVFWVRQAVERYICSNRGLIRIPIYIQQKVRRLKREGRIRNGMDDDVVREMTSHFSMDRMVAKHVADLYKGQVSLDGMDSNTKDYFLSWNNRERVLDDVDRSEELRLAERRLHRAIRRLTERERFVLARRYGLDNEEIQTLDRLGAELKLSRERVRQIEKGAISKLGRNIHL